jgi:ATP-binding cassette subfamily A (ABC1) protein 3
MFSLFLLIGYCIISGIFLYPIVQDKEFKMRYVLNFIGMKPFAYWLGSFFCDYALACIPSLAFLVIVAVGGVDALSHRWYIVGLVVLSFLFPLVTLTYCMTFLFKKSERAFRLIGTVYMLTGYMIPILLLDLTQVMSFDTMNIIASTLSVFIPFIPFFNTMVGLVIQYLIDTLKLTDVNFFYLTYFSDWRHSVPLMIAQGFVFFFLAWFIDVQLQNHFRKDDVKQPTTIPHAVEPDSDVIEQQNLVKNTSGNDTNIRVDNLHKTYSNGFAAVSGTSFLVGPREVLGLLGPNGAGKSTTFNVVTMDICRSFGDIQLMGQNLQEIKPSVSGNRLGICPQYNAIWNKLTVDEHFEFITKIKGLSDSDAKAQTEYLKRELELTDYSKTIAEALSGGNKRKLCCAVCLLASPVLTFLDEPTTGVVPVARRSLFNLLRKLKDSSVVLTTHRMDEAESLCDKIAI